MYREVDSSDEEDLDKAEFIDKETCGAELVWVRNPESQESASKYSEVESSDKKNQEKTKIFHKEIGGAELDKVKERESKAPASKFFLLFLKVQLISL